MKQYFASPPPKPLGESVQGGGDEVSTNKSCIISGMMMHPPH
jgi:hypothetical protein